MKLHLFLLASICILCVSALFQGCQTDPHSPSRPSTADPIYGEPDTPGFVEVNGSSWNVWHDLMPGVPPRLHIQGEVIVSASNYSVTLKEGATTDDTLHFNLKVRKTAGVGAQVLTTRKVAYSEKYSGAHASAVIHLPNGEEVVRQIKKVN